MRLEVGCHEVDYLVPFFGRDVDGADTLAFLVVAIFVNAPIKRCLYIVVDTLHNGKVGKFVLRWITHLDVVGAGSEQHECRSCQYGNHISFHTLLFFIHCNRPLFEVECDKVSACFLHVPLVVG